MDSILFQGTERWTLELSGTISRTCAQSHCGPRVEAAADAGRTRVSLVLFMVENLRFTAVPWVAVTYREALWRVAATFEGEELWVAARCDLDSLIARLGDGLFVGYHDRGARFDVADGPDSLSLNVRTAEGQLRVQASEFGGSSKQSPPRPLLIFKKGRLTRVPWEEVPAPTCTEVQARVSEDSLSMPTLGEAVAWDGAARLLRGRVHRCGKSVEI